MKTLISSTVAAAILVVAGLSSANADAPVNAAAPAARSGAQSARHPIRAAQPHKVQSASKTGSKMAPQNMLNQNSKHALNPQPIPPGRALNPQPLPPG